MGIYFIVGILYALINGVFRKINTDGDWLLSIVWIIAWPLCFIGLIAVFIQDKFKFKFKRK